MSSEDMAVGTGLFEGTLPVRLRANPHFFGDSCGGALKCTKKWPPKQQFPQALPELGKAATDVAAGRRRSASVAGGLTPPQDQQGSKLKAAAARTPPSAVAVTSAAASPELRSVHGERRKAQQAANAWCSDQAVYDHDDWSRHRSSFRHARHLFSPASARVPLLALRPPVFIVTLLAALVAAFNCAAVARQTVLPAWVRVLRVSALLPFQFAAPALGLLLLFRTNAAYGRFDEARKAWGSIVNRTRDLTRQALSWIRSPHDAHNLTRLLQYIVVFPVCLKSQLVPRTMLQDELSGLMEYSELATLTASLHRPNHVLQMISGLIQSCHISDVRIALMDGNVTQLHDDLGACERTFRTPVPVTYTRLTSVFLVLWHVALPLALWDQCGWTVVPATFLSATALFTIDEVGVLIEEPFSVLPLDTLCNNMERSVQCLVLPARQD